MSSTEQAPEPTMDEILASIRKIISEDETGQEASGEAPDAADDASMEIPGETGEADDILDLTQVVQSQSETPQPAMPPEAAAPQPEMQAEAAVAPEAPPVPAPPAPEAQQTDTSAEADIASILAEAGVEETAADGGASTGDPVQAGAAPQASEEEASITEALKAIDEPAGEAQAVEPAAAVMAESDGPGVEAFADSPTPEGGEAALPDEPAQDDPARDALDDLVASLESDMNAGEETLGEAVADQAIAMPEPAESEVAMPEPAQDAGPEIAMPSEGEPPAPAADIEAEAPTPEPAPAADFEAEAPAPEPAPAVEAPAETLEEIVADVMPEEVEDPQAEAVAPPAAGLDGISEVDESPEAGAADAESAAPSSFEQGIKEMIKPMLREWLDDNMERIVQDAVKEEVASGDK